VIHRDLKPDNVFLEQVAREKAIVKLLDFGLAKLAGDSNVAMTQSGAPLGTPIYMSPEQCRGKGVDHRTDLYALGCIGYELFCGRVPFIADNVAELMASHLGEQPPRPGTLSPDISPELDHLLLAMLDKDAARRPTLQQIRQTITTLRTTSPPPAQRAMSVSGPHPRRATVIGISAVGVLLAGVVTFVIVGRGQPGEPRNATRNTVPSAIDREQPIATETSGSAAATSVVDSPSGTETIGSAAVAGAPGSPTSPATRDGGISEVGAAALSTVDTAPSATKRQRARTATKPPGTTTTKSSDPIGDQDAREATGSAPQFNRGD
jgi:serine/threonine-protein kinase